MQNKFIEYISAALSAMSMSKSNKKGNVSYFTGIAIAIIGFVIVIGLGLVLLQGFADQTAKCGANPNYVYNTTLGLCVNQSNTALTATPTGTAYTGIIFGQSQLGSSGLLGWLPIIIILLVVVFFLAYFGGKQAGGGRY